MDRVLSYQSETFTKFPRIKKTPSSIETLQPTPDASTSIKFATVSPEFISVFPYTIDS